jgi:uncharacterized protein YdeI (YjbR/CyaY-like superfamily)
MISDPEAFFARGCGRCTRFDTPDCAARIWNKGLIALRRLCRDTGLSEHAKWGHPCYMAHGRNIAIIAATRSDFRLSFFEPALMTDPHCVLERQGKNTAHPDMLRFTDVAGLDVMQPVIRAYLAEAIGYAAQGIKPEKRTQELALPKELTDTLARDPVLAAAFVALTPGRQRSYVINLAGAKAAVTRMARIARFRDKIIAGKGATER